MRTIKLMADYECSPLWESSPGQVGNIDLDTLPLSQDLKARLINWARAYDATLNMDDPMSSRFETDAQEVEFKRIGNELGEKLGDELGPEFAVTIKI